MFSINIFRLRNDFQSIDYIILVLVYENSISSDALNLQHLSEGFLCLLLLKKLKTTFIPYKQFFQSSVLLISDEKALHSTELIILNNLYSLEYMYFEYVISRGVPRCPGQGGCSTNFCLNLAR